MLLIPCFVILLIYGYRGWALVVFVTAGTHRPLRRADRPRDREKTTLGAWLDPMADKLLLVTMFVMLTVPGLGDPNRLPLWFTVLVISRDVAIVVTVAVVNLAIGPGTFRPSIYGKIATAALHRHRGRRPLLQLPRRGARHRARPDLLVAGHHLHFRRPLRVAGGAHGPRDAIRQSGIHGGRMAESPNCPSNSLRRDVQAVPSEELKSAR